MMVKNLLMCLMLGMVAALPATALADVAWDGGAGDGVWANPVNWVGDVLPTNDFFTETARADGHGTKLIDASNGFTTWDRARVKDGTITQTGGTHRWNNYTSTYGLALFRNTSYLNMTGGTHYADRVILGDDQFAPPSSIVQDGVGIINIWGTGTFVVEPNTFNDPASDIYQIHDLIIVDGGSKIDIRDLGELHVPLDMISKIDGYITANKIVAGNAGQSLFTATVGDQYVVTAIPEPASLLLLGLGLGSLALIRRRRA